MYAYSMIQYENERRDEFVEKEMEQIKEKAVTKILRYAHLNNEALTKIILYAWQESLPEAQNLADDLDLCKMDFLAIAGDFEEFKEEYIKDLEMAGNF